MCNPIVEARIESGISVTSLAKKIGVSKQYVSRAEHGTYSSLNNDLVRFASAKLNIKPGEFIRRYKTFQNATRIATASEISPQMLARRGSFAPGNEIFATWRSGYWHSVISFCNAFCVHPEIVRAYEEGIRSDMPAAIKEILTEVGLLDPNWIDNPAELRKAIQLRESAPYADTRVNSILASHGLLKGSAKFNANDSVKFSTNFPNQRNRSAPF